MERNKQEVEVSYTELMDRETQSQKIFVIGYTILVVSVVIASALFIASKMFNFTAFDGVILWIVFAGIVVAVVQVLVMRHLLTK